MSLLCRELRIIYIGLYVLGEKMGGGHFFATKTFAMILIGWLMLVSRIISDVLIEMDFGVQLFGSVILAVLTGILSDHYPYETPLSVGQVRAILKGKWYRSLAFIGILLHLAGWILIFALASASTKS